MSEDGESESWKQGSLDQQQVGHLGLGGYGGRDIYLLVATTTHHSVSIYDRYVDYTMTLCRLRSLSGRPPDCT